MDFSIKSQRNILFAVTFGNLLEWYEIYLFVYWSPVLAKLFFKPDSGNLDLTYTFLIFALGFLARPLGGLFFGRLGDRIGRKKAFMLSLMMMTVPTLLTGLLPTREQVGVLAPLFLTCTRFLQAFPAGGELPGAFCYLYESAQIHNRRYFCSWACFGVLTGLLVSTIECFMLEFFLSEQDLITWGWRLSFILGGLIGFCGLLIRSRLHETALFQEMTRHTVFVKEPILEVLFEEKKALIKGILFWAFNSSTVFFITVNVAGYFRQMLNNNELTTLAISCGILILITAPLPFFGYIADRINNKKLLVGSTLACMVLLMPMYYFVHESSLFGLAVTIVAFSLLFTCNTALLSYVTPDLFPTRVRFTCVGVSFNVADSLFGGFTPFIVLYLTQLSDNLGSFFWVILFFSIISLISYILMKEKRPING